MKFVLILLQIVIINQQLVNSYNVALVEYLYDDQILPNIAPYELADRKAKIYHEIVGKIKKIHEKLDLVVFPEFTLKNTATIVPNAKDNIVPCYSTENYPSFFKLISCTAQKYRTYIVINLTEKNNNKIYNTDVVFDRNGTVVARYRKYHPYLEPGTDRTTEPELVTFETDFGVKFGIFTCFDVLYDSPAVDLVKMGVKNFVFPTFWFPELPFLTTIQTQQMWAQGNDVTFLTAGAAYPLHGCGAVGMFLGNKGVLGKNLVPRTDNYYLYEKIPERENFRQRCEVAVDDEIAEQLDKYTLFAEDLSGYAHKILDTQTSKNIEEELCQQQGNKQLCCNYKIETKITKTPNNSSTYTYFLITRYGSRTYGNSSYTGGAEICALLACPGKSIENCGKRFPVYNQISWPVTFEKIEISATFEKAGKIQYPNSLLADFSPILPSCTTWKTEIENSTIKRTFSTNLPVTKVLTFAIWGRNFNLDF